jgi:hypothetical protein
MELINSNGQLQKYRKGDMKVICYLMEEILEGRWVFSFIMLIFLVWLFELFNIQWVGVGNFKES